MGIFAWGFIGLIVLAVVIGSAIWDLIKWVVKL